MRYVGIGFPFNGYIAGDVNVEPFFNGLDLGDGDVSAAHGRWEICGCAAK
jgi:hypothetical protein